LKGIVEVDITDSWVDIRIVCLEPITSTANLLRSCADNAGGPGKRTLVIHFPWLPVEATLSIFKLFLLPQFFEKELMKTKSVAINAES
jgi:hypothetical protein